MGEKGASKRPDSSEGAGQRRDDRILHEDAVITGRPTSQLLLSTQSRTRSHRTALRSNGVLARQRAQRERATVAESFRSLPRVNQTAIHTPHDGPARSGLHGPAPIGALEDQASRSGAALTTRDTRKQSGHSCHASLVSFNHVIQVVSRSRRASGPVYCAPSRERVKVR